MVLMITDVVDSVQTKTTFGTPAYSALIRRHDELFRAALGDTGGGGAVLQDTGDGFCASFATASAAVRCALRFQHDLSVEPWTPVALKVRVGIHLGEMAEVRPGGSAGGEKLAGLAVDVASRVSALAIGGQILMTRAAFNDARQFISEHPSTPSVPLRWMAHGTYLIKGLEDPAEIFEVGSEAAAPLGPPPDSKNASRAVPHDLEETLGWRPAAGLEIPGRDAWLLDRKLGEGGFGEVWLGRHAKLHQHRVFKFCFDPERLRSFKRELTLFRLIRDALGDRADIARLHEVKLDRAPFLLESEYTEGGNLTDWADALGGIGNVPMATRVDLVARIADAVAAAHSVGILHKDIKPSNVLVYTDKPTGEPRPRLSDFGIGMLTDRAQLGARQITETGFTLLTQNESSRTGTRMYAPPESLTDRPFTVQGDVYALGVLLYQMATADLSRPLGVGWERDVPDEFLRADIAACVDVDPGRRLPAASELAARLRNLDSRRDQARQDRESAAAEKDRIAAFESAARKRRRLATIAVVLGVLTTVATALTFYSLHQKNRAVGSELEAVRQKQIAEQATARAVDQQQQTTAALADVQREKATAEEQGYFAAIAAAADAIKLNQPALVWQYLDATAPRLRRWEWGYLRGQTDTSLAVFPGLDLQTALASFSADGSRVVTESSTGGERLFDTASGRLLAKISDAGPLTNSDISRDLARLAVPAGKDVRVWDTAAARQIATLRGHTAPVQSVAFSPDRTLLVTASDDRTARVWDVETGRQIRLLKHPGEVVHAEFGPDGSHILTVCDDFKARVWSTDGTGKDLVVFNGHTGRITQSAFSPDGSRILTVSDDRTARVWNSSDGAVVLDIPAAGPAVDSAYFSPDGSRLAVASGGVMPQIWDIAAAAKLPPLAGYSGLVIRYRFSPDGNRMVTAAFDGTARVSDVRTGALITVFNGHGSAVYSANFSPDGSQVVTSSADRTARVWTAADGNEVAVLRGHDDMVFDAEFSADGRHILTASADGTSRMWNGDFGPVPARQRPSDPSAIPVERLRAMTRDELAAADAAPRRVRHVAFNSDCSQAVSVGTDDSVQTWEIATGRRIKRVCGDSLPDRVRSDRLPKTVTTSPSRQFVRSAEFSPDGSHLVITGGDSTVRFCDLATGTFRSIPTGHTDEVIYANFSSDGTRLVTASVDKSARIVDPAAGTSAMLFSGGKYLMNFAAFSPDGSRVVCTSAGSAWICDPANHTSIALEDKQRHTRFSDIVSGAFSSDGRWVVTAAASSDISTHADNTARVWDARTGAMLCTLSGHTKGLNSAAFSPDSSRVVTSSGDGTACVWDSASGRLLCTLDSKGVAVLAAAFTPDGTRIVTAAADGSFKIWDSVSAAERYSAKR